MPTTDATVAWKYEVLKSLAAFGPQGRGRSAAAPFVVSGDRTELALADAARIATRRH
jgi:hypothetical protein